MQKQSLTQFGGVLQDSLNRIYDYEAQYAAQQQGPKVHVPDVGTGLSVAYEQLRNASEDTANHLLFQRAILRFYRRNLPLDYEPTVKQMGSELIIELTQAGYIPNDSVLTGVADAVDRLIHEYYGLYGRIIHSKKDTPPADAARWILEILSVRTEQLFHPPIRALSFAHVAHSHMSSLITVSEHGVDDEMIQPDEQQRALYIAVHKALLKSDDANIRSALMDIYTVRTSQTVAFIESQQTYDRLTRTKTVAALARLISRNGAPLRAINTTFFRVDDEIGSRHRIAEQHQAMNAVDAQLDADYQQVRRNLNSGIVKSIVFLFLTKILIGLLIEVPYDLIVYGTIIVLPLIVNLVAPPVFLALSTLTVKQPSVANKRAVLDYVETMLYETDRTIPVLRRRRSVEHAGTFTVLYAITAFAVIGLVGWGLYLLNFNIVQGIIFFVFFSTAMFLGYRLTLQVRELELVQSDQGAAALLRDFVFTPFIFLGQKISFRFSQLNMSAQILDVLIELPLKTFLRLVRQWTTFLSSRKDELL